MDNYLVIYEKGAATWGAYLPDFPGCVAVGKSREEVEKSIRTALKMHIKGMKEDGLPLPAPTLTLKRSNSPRDTKGKRTPFVISGRKLVRPPRIVLYS